MVRLTLLFLLMVCTRPAHAGPLDFEGLPASQLVVTFAADPPDRLFTDITPFPHMANRLLGIVAIIQDADRRRLALASRRAEPTGWPQETEILGHAHATGDSGDVRTFQLGLTPDRLLLFRDIDSDLTEALPADQCAPLLDPLLGYAGGFVSAYDHIPAETVTLAQPYRAAPVVFDETTIRHRLNGGRRSELPETQRYLPEERLLMRLPRDCSPRRPAGLIVWINPTNDGAPPDILHAAADQLGCVLVGIADAGNRRLSTDRYQLALDAVATVRSRVHVDPSRVYAAGFSGGARVASTLVACFPEVFTGAIPVGALSAPRPVPLGDGRFVVNGYREPDGATWRLFRQRRVAPISGPLDFNHRETVHAVQMLERERAHIRLFEYEDMAHTLPTPERLAEALRWIDAPASRAREEAAQEAAKLLDGYLARFGPEPLALEDADQRRIDLLTRVTVVAPWSDAAWRACALLGIAPAPQADPQPAPPPAPTNESPQTP